VRRPEHATAIRRASSGVAIHVQQEPNPAAEWVDNGRVIRAGTVSKILGAGFRLG
jgi:hypothetical protein